MSIPIYLKLKGTPPPEYKIDNNTLIYNEKIYEFSKILNNEGNEQDELQERIDDESDSCCYIFMGPTGSGKTTTMKKVLESKLNELRSLKSPVFVSAIEVSHNRYAIDLLERELHQAKKEYLLHKEFNTKKEKLDFGTKQDLIKRIFRQRSTHKTPSNAESSRSCLILTLSHNGKRIIYMDLMGNERFDKTLSSANIFANMNMSAITLLLTGKRSTNVRSSNLISNLIFKRNTQEKERKVNIILVLDPSGDENLNKSSLRNIAELVQNFNGVSNETKKTRRDNFILKKHSMVEPCLKLDSMPHYSRPTIASRSSSSTFSSPRRRSHLKEIKKRSLSLSPEKAINKGTKRSRVDFNYDLKIDPLSSPLKKIRPNLIINDIKINSTELEIEKLKKTIRELQEDFMGSQEKIRNLEELNLTLQNQNGVHEMNIQTLQETNHILDGKNRKLQDENQSVYDLNDDLEVHNNFLEEKNKHFQEENNSLYKVNENLEKKNESLQQEIDLFQAQIKSLQHEFDKVETQKLDLNNNNQQLLSKIKKYQEDNIELENNLFEINQNIDLIKQENSNLLILIESSNEKVNEQNNVIIELTDKNSKQVIEKNILIQQWSELRDDFIAFQSEHDSFSSLVEAIKLQMNDIKRINEEKIVDINKKFENETLALKDGHMKSINELNDQLTSVKRLKNELNSNIVNLQNENDLLRERVSEEDFSRQSDDEENEKEKSELLEIIDTKTVQIIEKQDEITALCRQIKEMKESNSIKLYSLNRELLQVKNEKNQMTEKLNQVTTELETLQSGQSTRPMILDSFTSPRENQLLPHIDFLDQFTNFNDTSIFNGSQIYEDTRSESDLLGKMSPSDNDSDMATSSMGILAPSKFENLNSFTLDKKSKHKPFHSNKLPSLTPIHEV